MVVHIIPSDSDYESVTSPPYGIIADTESETEVESVDVDTDEPDRGAVVPHALRLARLLMYGRNESGMSVGPARCCDCLFWHRTARECPAASAQYFLLHCGATDDERDAVSVCGANYVLVGFPGGDALVSLLFFAQPVTASAVEAFFQPHMVLVTHLYDQDSVNFALNEVQCGGPFTTYEAGNQPPLVRASPGCPPPGSIPRLVRSAGRNFVDNIRYHGYRG